MGYDYRGGGTNGGSQAWAQYIDDIRHNRTAAQRQRDFFNRAQVVGGSAILGAMGHIVQAHNSQAAKDNADHQSLTATIPGGTPNWLHSDDQTNAVLGGLPVTDISHYQGQAQPPDMVSGTGANVVSQPPVQTWGGMSSSLPRASAAPTGALPMPLAQPDDDDAALLTPPDEIQ